jgi:hypothetical protein
MDNKLTLEQEIQYTKDFYERVHKRRKPQQATPAPLCGEDILKARRNEEYKKQLEEQERAKNISREERKAYVYNYYKKIKDRRSNKKPEPKLDKRQQRKKFMKSFYDKDGKVRIYNDEGILNPRFEKYYKK